MDKRKVRALSGSFPSGASLHPIWSDLLLEPRLRDSPFSGGAHFMCRLPNFRAKALDFAPSNAAIFSGRFKLKTLWSRVAGRSAILLTSRNPGDRHAISCNPISRPTCFHLGIGELYASDARSNSWATSSNLAT